MASVKNTEEEDHIRHYSSTLDTVSAPQIICQPDLEKLFDNIDLTVEKDIYFEHILGRNILTNLQKGHKTLEKAKTRLTPNGDIVLCETIVSEASRLSDFIHMGPLQDILLEAEKKIYSKTPTRKDILETVKAHFLEVSVSDFNFTESRIARESDVMRWIRNSYIPNLDKLTQNEAEKLEKELISLLCAAPLMWNTNSMIICLRKAI